MGLHGYVFAFGAVYLGCEALMGCCKAERQALVAVDRAVESIMRASGLFAEWQKARPFLWVGQSPYAQSLILGMMDDVRIMAKYARRYNWACAEECDRALLALEKMLQQDPPPYGPPNLNKLLRELVSFPSLPLQRQCPIVAPYETVNPVAVRRAGVRHHPALRIPGPLGSLPEKPLHKEGLFLFSH